MQIKITYTSDTQALLAIVADTTALQNIKEQVLTQFAKSAKITGFRQGKAPLNLVEKNVDAQVLQNQFLEEAIEQLYVHAVTTEKIRVVAAPKVALKKFVPYSTLEFDAEVPVVKAFKLPDYTKLKLAKDKVTVTADDISQIIKNLQARSAERKEVDRGAKNGDEVVIDFKGLDAKTEESINGADGKDYPLLLGSDAFIPGFESNLLSSRAGDEKVFTVTFPKDYGVKALVNRKVTFHVTVKKVQEVIEPKVDDVFAASVGPFKTVQELKADIKQQLTTERQQEMDRTYQSELVKLVVGKTTVAIPQQLVDEQIERIEQEERQNLLYRGQTWEEHLKEEGVDERQHKEEKRPIAEERIKTSLVLAEIAEQEKVSVTSEELELRIQLLKSQYKDPAMLAELAKPESRRDIEARLLTEKTLDKLVTYAIK